MPLDMVKALRWYIRASLIPFPDLYGGLFLRSTNLGDAPRKKAMSLPLLIVVELERLVVSVFAPVGDRCIAGACLICVWGSLRFADAQHVEWSSLVSDDVALRGICSRSKTNHRGSAFGVLSVGLLTPVFSLSQSWTCKLMLPLEGVRSRIASESGLGDLSVPDALVLHSDTSGNYAVHHEPAFAFQGRALQGHHKMDSLLYTVVMMYGSPLQIREWLDEPCFQVGDLVVLNIVVGNAQLPSRGSSSFLYRTWGISQLKLIFQLLPSQLQLRRC